MLLELPNGENLEKGLLGLGKEFRVYSEYEQISLKSFFLLIIILTSLKGFKQRYSRTFS